MMLASQEGKKSKQVLELLAGLGFQYLKMVANVYQCIDRSLIEDPGLDFMVIDSVGEQGHKYAVLYILVCIFCLILPDPGIDIVNGFSHVHLFFFGYLQRYCSTGDDCFYSVHT